jgi:hypothetical protein
LTEANPVEAVTAQYERGLIGTMVDRARERVAKVGDFINKGEAIFLSSVALAGAGAALAPEAASANATAGTPQTTEQTLSTKFSIGASRMSESAFAEAHVLGNHRTISAAKLRKAEKLGKCVTLNGKKVDIWTQGHDEKGYPMGKDTRTSRFCKVAGKWYRKLCGNRAVFHKPKKAVENVVWVKNFNKASVLVTTNAEAKAQAECHTENASAMAYGHGEASASARVRLSSAMRAKGKFRKLISDVKAGITAKAKSRAEAEAVAICEQDTVTTTPPPQEQGAKDGTQTPPPPSEAPGANPQPDPNEPYPGGYQCYDETTGAPTQPRTDGNCPAGSYGA